MATYVGMDVHKKNCQAAAMDEEGTILKEEKVENSLEGFEPFFRDIEDAEVVIESCYSWRPTYERLKDLNLDVTMAHPKRTEAVTKARKKTDSVDSKTLAHLLRADMVPESYIPPKEVRKLRDLVRMRTKLVRDRSRLKARVRAELEKNRIRVDSGKDIFTKKRKEWLRELGIYTVDQYLPVIDTLDERIKVVSKRVKEEAGENQDAMLLTSIYGVSYFTALLIVSEIGEIDRFPDPEKLCAYFGLVPKVHQSGETVKYGSITKEGSGLVRWALVQAVFTHIKSDSKLTRYYKKVKKKKGSGKAATATARKMLTIMYFMLKRGEKFRPF
ncbi:hypothetical protein AKJ64_00430 [candidate division MSBL1 archaeon SCGC-AAA259E17]|uniref:Uncharacterized protein n=1 Tax=candidate division MSBL1 archaeon SCGC-AAA259E17 TaxID=1698263 RepID=A0A133UH33_9EURY|nr:hypothetical protein AKJ64_00430 [candidate division MSBL1 archaeon SCGC-AAA259E17]